jgi:hypothetical protein
MSCHIVISLPGLTRDVAEELARRADLAGAPFTFLQVRRHGFPWRKSEVSLRAEFVDLDSDPSIASESLDFEHGWPHDPDVRAWFGRAMRFLGENAPEGGFAFSAGWTEHWDRETDADLDLDAFLERIASGILRSGERYNVGRS